MAIQVGIGSWADPEYTGVLYPKGVKPERRLATYATWFNHVEVNSSYYRTPSRAAVATWVKQTPDDFTFSFKLHRAFSQNPAKAAAGDLPKLVRRAVEPLIRSGRLHAFLVVMPPSFGPERHELSELDPLVEAFRPHRIAVEIRDSAWIRGAARARTFGYFRERKLVWVGVDMPRIKGSAIMPPLDAVTNPALAYLRLHGRNRRWLSAKSAADRHQHDYTARELGEIARRVKRVAGDAPDVCVIANNHARDFAPKAAFALQRLLGVSSSR